jgi:hypothetical protein
MSANLLFDVRRSIRYHDRRRAFFVKLHRLTSVLTILLSGSVVFRLAGAGQPAAWLTVIGVAAAVLAAADMVANHSASANRHEQLRGRFIELELALLADPDDTGRHQRARLAIERDEPPIYRALDALCHNELALAGGYGEEYLHRVGPLPRLTSQWLQWSDIASS